MRLQLTSDYRSAFLAMICLLFLRSLSFLVLRGKTSSSLERLLKIESMQLTLPPKRTRR